jgi:hypothetical protein
MHYKHLMNCRHAMNSLRAFAYSLAGTALSVVFGAIVASAALADVRVTGPADAIQVEAQDAPLSEVLTALGATSELHDPNTTNLSRPLTGTYTGSVGEIISRLLAGYDYIVKKSDGRLTIMIYGMSTTTRIDPTATTPAQNIAQNNVPETTPTPAANVAAKPHRRAVPVIATQPPPPPPPSSEKSAVATGLEMAALSQIQGNASGAATTAVPAGPAANMGALTQTAVSSLQSLVAALGVRPQKK